MTKGKFGNETSAAKQKKKTILQTYLTSLVSLVLCVTMFFGTTAAWFTDTVTTSQNEIVVGTLDVNLKHASFKSGALEAFTDVETQDYKVLKSDIKWEPGYTAVEKFKVTENGTLAFGYKLTITLQNAGTLSEQAFETLTKAITVWNYVGNNAANYTLPGTFADMVASDWQKVGTLYEVLNNHLTVFSGTMDATKVAAANAEAEHIIALHMDESFDGVVAGTETVQGKTLSGITVRLVATQMPSENDAFGNTYDQQVDLQVTQAVESNNGVTTKPVSMSVTNSNSPIAAASVEIPAGAQVEAGTTALTMNITENTTHDEKTTVVAGQSVIPLMIDVPGLASNNTTVVTVVLNIAKNLPNVQVYHNGQPMNEANSGDNTFTYDATNGILTLRTSKFSPFDVVYGDVVVVSTAAELTAAINDGASEIYLSAGTYKMPSISGNMEFTITGTKDAIVDLTLGAYMDSSKVSFEGVTIKGSTGKANGNGSDYAALYTPDVTYTNCTFEGPFFVGRDGATFINCTFTKLGNDYVWTYGNDATFENCTFESEGKALLIYSDGGNEVSKVVVKNCVFNATQGAKAGAIANQNCAAIEIQNYGNGVDLITEGNTIDSDFSGEWRIKSYHAERPAVIVNGVKYESIALDGKLMTIDSNKNVTVVE